jgi:hypothetical protein
VALAAGALLLGAVAMCDKIDLAMQDWEDWWL